MQQSTITRGFSAEPILAGQVQSIRIALLLATCAVAADLPENLTSIIGLDIPVIGATVPPFSTMWAPFLLLVIWFNAMVDGNGRFLLRLDRSVVWFLAWIAIMGAMEIAHALRFDTLPETEQFIRFGWIFLVFATLTTFATLQGVTQWMLLGFAVFSCIAVVLMLIVPDGSIARQGIRTFFVSEFRPSVSVVNSAAYQFTLVALLGIGTLLFRQTARMQKTAWIFFSLIAVLGVLGTRSRGAWLVLIGGALALLLMRAFRPRILISALVAGVVVFVFAGGAKWGSQLDEFLSLGRGLHPVSEMRNLEGTPNPGGGTGIAIRITMIKKVISDFLQQPVFGQGKAAVMEDRTGGHAPHGIPFLLLAAYGLAGAVPGLIFVWSLATGKRAAEYRIVALTSAGVLIAATLAFHNPRLWFAGALYLAGFAGRNEVR